MSEHPLGTEGEPVTAEPPLAADHVADDSRSGSDIAEAIGTAEAGSAVRESHTHPERTKSWEAYVEQVADDPAMTQGQRVPAEATEADDTSSHPSDGDPDSGT